MKSITNDFEKKVIREGIVDTAKYRYVTRDVKGDLAIYRLPIEMLDTTAALTDWELVKNIK